MSNVTIKNDTMRALVAAVRAGTLPKGVEFEGKLENRTLSIAIVAAPFNCLKDDKIEVTPTGFSYSVQLFGQGEASSYTPEAEALEAKVKEIAAAVVQRRVRFYIHHSTKWIAAQAAAVRAGKSLAA